MTSDVEENNTSIEPTEPEPKARITYSKSLIDRITNKLSEDMSLNEICKAFDWAPSLSTARRWECQDAYAKRQFEAGRTNLLEAKRRDRLTELRHVDLADLAQKCALLDQLSPSMKEALFKAMVNHLYKEQDAIYKELEKQMPEKYGTRVTTDINFKDETKGKSLTEIQVLLQSFVQDNRFQTLLDASASSNSEQGKITHEIKE